jgi:ankyrin repeat protein
MVDQWLLAGARLSAHDDAGMTILMLAARHGDDGMIGFLLSRGAAADQQNPYTGDTALIIAARRGHAAAVERLLISGALAAARNIAGQSALCVATGAARDVLLESEAPRLRQEAAARAAARLAAARSKRPPPRL